ncbi:MAG: sporulation protein YabP [Clostridia bacterium]|nr:sporulation protein YabP [Clostridia bacterium]
MEEKVITTKLQHNVLMESRSKLVLSGVKEVDSFEEDNVVLKTTKGNLTIRGNGMKMESYNNEVGDLVLNGDIFALVYTNDKENTSGGFFSRIFK